MKENWNNPKWKNKIPSRDADVDMMSIVWIELGILSEVLFFHCFKKVAENYVKQLEEW